MKIPVRLFTKHIGDKGIEEFRPTRECIELGDRAHEHLYVRGHVFLAETVDYEPVVEIPSGNTATITVKSVEYRAVYKHDGLLVGVYRHD